jgi:hypothetical protein
MFIMVMSALAPLRAVAQGGIPPEEQELLARVRQSALRFRGHLPDFVCIQITKRWEGRSGAGTSWKLKDTLEEQVVFAKRGQETKKLVKVNGKATQKSMFGVGGIVENLMLSGTILPLGIFGQQAKPQFQWSGFQDVSGRRMAVFSFPAEGENYPDGKHRYVLALHGRVFADPDDDTPLRIENTAVGPPGYPFGESGWDADYAPVRIGERELVLPVTAVMSGTRGKLRWKSEIQFTSYRKFDSESAIKFGDPN